MGAVVKAKHSRLPEPGSNSPRREGPKRTSEGMKKSRLQDKAALSQEEMIKLAWADQSIEEETLHFASKPAMASMGRFANKVEMLANKRQRSHESVAKVVCKGVFWSIFNKKQLAWVFS